MGKGPVDSGEITQLHCGKYRTSEEDSEAAEEQGA